MSPAPPGRLRRLLYRPMFGTVVIPPDARVDPTAFPEDEFPFWCAGCGHALRGLAKPVCPECGRPFDRGRLLVDEYVCLKVNRRSWAGHWAIRLWCTAVAVLGLLVLFAVVDHFYAGALSQHPLVDKYSYVPMVLLGAVDAALIVLLIVLRSGVRAQRARRKAVRDALSLDTGQDSPG